MIATTSPAPGPEPVGRAAPMSAEDRRAAILRSTVPLLRARGVNLTTRELAAAAGVAEGTLFRVFPDKAALIHAAVRQALDPAPTVAALAALDRDEDLRRTLVRAVEILIVRSREAAELLSVIHQGGMDAAGGRGHSGRDHGGRDHSGHGHHDGEQHASNSHNGAASDRSSAGRHPVQVVVSAMTGLLADYRGQLRWEPEVCARTIVGLVLVNARMMPPAGDDPLDPSALVALFLDGALARPIPTAPTIPATSEIPC